LKTHETKENISSKNARITFDFNKITQEKLTNTSALLTVVPIISETKKQRTRALLLKIDNVIETILYNEYPESSSTKNSFTGIILMSKLNGDFIRAYRLKNNEYVIDLMPTKKSTNKNSTTAKEINAANPEQLDEVYVYNYYRDPSYSYVPLEYNNQNPYAHADMFLWDSGGSGGGNYYAPTTEEIAKTIEDSIDVSQLDPCPKGVMESLKNTTNATIVDVLAKLGANSIYTINMAMKPADTYAETQRISKYNYEIRVDRDRYTDGTKLFKATALIHEIIHAYFLSIVDDYNYTPSTALPSFPELFEAFVLKEHPTSKDKQDAQHLAMANKYVDAMASALQEYDANYTIDYQVYKDLAWGSLRDAPIFEKTFPKGSTDNIRIANRYKAESSGHAVEMGTPDQQSPVGKPCK